MKKKRKTVAGAMAPDFMIHRKNAATATEQVIQERNPVKNVMESEKETVRSV